MIYLLNNSHILIQHFRQLLIGQWFWM